MIANDSVHQLRKVLIFLGVYDAIIAIPLVGLTLKTMGFAIIFTFPAFIVAIIIQLILQYKFSYKILLSEKFLSRSDVLKAYFDLCNYKVILLVFLLSTMVSYIYPLFTDHVGSINYLNQICYSCSNFTYFIDGGYFFGTIPFSILILVFFYITSFIGFLASVEVDYK